MTGYFAEEGFGAWMQQEVEPYLRQHGEQGSISGSGGVSFHYNRYQSAVSPLRRDCDSPIT